MNKYRIVLLTCLIMISPLSFSANSTTQIGNSYFQKPKKKSSDLVPRTISQFGAAMEEHQTLDVFYLFLNQMFTNHVYYELRAYGIYNYITQLPPASPIASEVISISDERHQIGYGGVGILGYNFFVNPNVSFMPFIRLQDLTNSVAAYRDTLGNEIHSDNYTAFFGGKLSLRVNNVFAMYAQFFAGPQRSILTGEGIFSTPRHPVIKSFVSTFELGAPYKITKAWSVTPYIQFLRTHANPDFYARNIPYNISSLTVTSNVYAIKLGYEF